MLLKGFLLVSYLFISFYTPGQSYIFKVMANKGENFYKSPAKNQWEPIKAGSNLNKGDWIKISNDQSFLGLVHLSGRTLELIESGTFDIEQLNKRFGLQNNGIASRFSEFVFNNIDEAVAGRKPDKGSESRGEEGEIKLLIPRSGKVFGDKIVLQWTVMEKNSSGGFNVSVKNVFDDQIKSIQTVDKQVIIDIDKGELEMESSFYINVVAGNDEIVHSDIYNIKRLSKNQKVLIEEDIRKIGEEVDRKSATGLIVLATYFEKQELLIDAISCYHQAIQSQPDLADFQILYKSFVERNALGR
ncbi:MAG: hypothetical protein OEY51_10750 [Cyclobacteriaceae bacterium]|nr:hypothetical protein [Cyclobacteriaceae bacterium]